MAMTLIHDGIARRDPAGHFFRVVDTRAASGTDIHHGAAAGS